MTQELISVIIPIYNTEKYLDKCISSVVNQTYKNLEIILINDGSEDRSGEICNEWAAKDSRILVIHQKNQGVSKARNCGLKAMTGFAFAPIDSDDYLASTYIETMYNSMSKNQSDLVFCNFINIKVDGKLETNKRKLVGKSILRNKQIKSKIWGKFGYYIGGGCKLYKASILKSNNLTFNEKLTNGEDWIFLNDFLTQCSIVTHTGETLYYREKRNNSLSSNMQKSQFLHTSLHLMEEMMLEKEKLKEYDPWMNRKLAVAVEVIISSHRHQYYDYNSYNSIKLFIKQNRFSFLKHGKTPILYKVKLLVKLYFPKLSLLFTK